MCLYSISNKAKKSKKDIVCYKILCRIKYEENFRTPFRGTKISDEIINGKIDFIADGEKNIVRDSFSFKYYVVDSGFIHTYTDLEMAFIVEANLQQYQSFYYFNVFECIIPKNTEYFEGERDYASEKIKFVRQID